MRIYLVITEFDSSQYCEPDIYKDIDAVFDSEEKAKQCISLVVSYREGRFIY